MSRDIPLSLIDPDPDQPRRSIDPATQAELVQSMAANGLAVAILVRPVGERFTLVHGERRWRGAGTLGWPTIRAEVRDLTADEAHWLALIENVQRADLSPVEEARAYEARLAGGITQEALGARIGKSQSYISQKLRLLTLPDPLVTYLDWRALTEGHARQLLRLRAWYHDLACDLPPAALDLSTWGASRRAGEPPPAPAGRPPSRGHAARDCRPAGGRGAAPVRGGAGAGGVCHAPGRPAAAVGRHGVLVGNLRGPARYAGRRSARRPRPLA